MARFVFFCPQFLLIKAIMVIAREILIKERKKDFKMIFYSALTVIAIFITLIIRRVTNLYCHVPNFLQLTETLNEAWF